jgi:hypothetical protein
MSVCGIIALHESIHAQGIEVDMFGRCNPLRCPHPLLLALALNTDCKWKASFFISNTLKSKGPNKWDWIEVASLWIDGNQTQQQSRA